MPRATRSAGSTRSIISRAVFGVCQVAVVPAERAVGRLRRDFASADLAVATMELGGPSGFGAPLAAVAVRGFLARDVAARAVVPRDVVARDVPVRAAPARDVLVRDVPVRAAPVRDVPVRAAPARGVRVLDVPALDVPVLDALVRAAPVRGALVLAVAARDVLARGAAGLRAVEPELAADPERAAGLVRAGPAPLDAAGLREAVVVLAGFLAAGLRVAGLRAAVLRVAGLRAAVLRVAGLRVAGLRAAEARPAVRPAPCRTAAVLASVGCAAGADMSSLQSLRAARPPVSCS